MGNNENDSESMLLPEVAQLTRLPTSTLRWMRHKGEGPPAAKAGRRLVYRRADVLEWLAELKREQQAGAGDAASDPACFYLQP